MADLRGVDGKKLPQQVQELRKEQAIPSDHPLLDSDVSWGGGMGPDSTLGGSNETQVWKLTFPKPGTAGESTLTIAPIRGGNYDWDSGKTRPLDATDVGALITILSERLAELQDMRAEDVKSSQGVEEALALVSRLKGAVKAIDTKRVRPRTLEDMERQVDMLDYELSSMKPQTGASADEQKIEEAILALSTSRRSDDFT